MLPLRMFRARSSANDIFAISRRRDVLEFDGARRAWRKAFELSGMTLDDLSFVETHDCFTMAELLEYEAMGLAAQGEGYKVIREVAKGDGSIGMLLGYHLLWSTTANVVGTEDQAKSVQKVLIEQNLVSATCIRSTQGFKLD